MNVGEHGGEKYLRIDQKICENEILSNEERKQSSTICPVVRGLNDENILLVKIMRR